MTPEQLTLFDAPAPPQPAPAAPEPPEWRPAPDAGYRAAQEAARERGWALDWSGQQYTLWRPPWRYTHSPTLPPLAALIAPAPAPAEGPLPADLVDAGMVVGPLPYMITINDGCSVGVTFALPTLEQNIAAAREYLGYARARVEAEAAQAAAKAAKKKTRKAS
jgi:hypothetical protein